jgi:integrase
MDLDPRTAANSSAVTRDLSQTMPPQCALLAAAYDQSHPTRSRLGPNLVFTGRYGTAVDPRTLNRRFTARCDVAGVRRLTVHDARRTCATLLVDLDVHPRVIMRILRHADQAVTMEIHAKASSKATREALRRLGESLR